MRKHLGTVAIWLLAIAFLLYFPLAHPAHLHLFSDGESYYRLGIRMFSSPDFGNNLGDAVWPLGMPTLLGLFAKADPTLLAYTGLAVLGLVCFKVAVWKSAPNRFVGWLLVFCAGLPLLSGYLFSEVPFAFCLGLLFVAVNRAKSWKGYLFIGVLVGLATLLRSSAFPCALVAFGLQFYRSRDWRSCLAITATFALVLLPQVIFFSKTTGQINLFGLNPTMNLGMGWQLKYRTLAFADDMTNGVIGNLWSPDGVRHQPPAVKQFKSTVLKTPSFLSEVAQGLSPLDVPQIIVRNSGQFFGGGLFPVDADPVVPPGTPLFLIWYRATGAICLVSIAYLLFQSRHRLAQLSPAVQWQRHFLLTYVALHILSLGSARYRAGIEELAILTAATILLDSCQKDRRMSV